MAKPGFVLVLEQLHGTNEVSPLAYLHGIMTDFLFCRMVLSVASLTLQRTESLARLRRP